MTSYDKYVFALCVIVFAVLTVLFTMLVASVAKLSITAIRCGVEDANIVAEYEKGKLKKKKRSVAGICFSALLCLVFFFLCFVSLYTKIVERDKTSNFPVFRAVYSSSMSEKNEKNGYLFSENLGDQFNRFDLILTRPLPDEFDLKLYDIAVYQSKDGDLIIHRIVGIEEPNEKHPDGRLFVFQGDALNTKDKYPVTYGQLRGVYCGERIAFAGSFVLFLQSPAGILCVLLIVFGMIAIPRMERQLLKAKRRRLAFLYRQYLKEKARGKRVGATAAKKRVATKTTSAKAANTAKKQGGVKSVKSVKSIKRLNSEKAASRKQTALKIVPQKAKIAEKQNGRKKK